MAVWFKQKDSEAIQTSLKFKHKQCPEPKWVKTNNVTVKM